MIALAPQEVGEVGRGLELPALAALDQPNAAVGVVHLQRCQCLTHVGAAQMRGELLDG
jgi:hypothetical protein